MSGARAFAGRYRGWLLALAALLAAAFAMHELTDLTPDLNDPSLP